MNRNACTMTVLAIALAVGARPALAQYSGEFTAAHLLHQGKTTHSIAGSGRVVVQVQVNADGSHKAIRVIHSTNSGDNDAAMDIAQNSTYRPAHRGSTPMTAFYDFTLNFHGKSVAQSQSEGGPAISSSGLSSAGTQIAALIRQGQFAQAKAKAEAALLNAPDDNSVRQMLGVAEYDQNDFVSAAAVFDKVPTISAQFRSAAAQSFAAAAVHLANTDSDRALAYAQKAVALQSTTNSRFALGVAQLATGDKAAALESLKAAHEMAMRDAKIPVNSKVNIDAELMQAYLAAGDAQSAQTIAAQIKQLDPSSTAGSQAMGVSLIKSGQAALAAKDWTTALNDFDQAAATGDTTIAVTANVAAAFAIAQGPKPDYKRMQSYADKAIALQPNDAQANFAEGIALTGQWAASHDDGTKTKAVAALNRADEEAKASGNESLALQIESFVKQNLNGSPAGGAGSG
jgi:Flp pilus assembly protein TadD